MAWAEKAFDDFHWEIVNPELPPDKLPKSGWRGIGWFRLHLEVDAALWNRPLAFAHTHIGATEISGGDEWRLEKIAGRYLPDSAKALTAYHRDHPGASPFDVLIALTTDYMFRIPALRLAEAHAANGGATWNYLFSWRSRAFGGRLGATHALEIPFTFNNLERVGVETFLGEGPLPQSLAEDMHASWIAFIRHGDPNNL